MEQFNYHNYEKMPDNQVLLIKLRDKDESIFVCRIYRSVLQGFQPEHTPITKINLEVVKNLKLHKQDKEDYENHYELMVEPEEIESFELIEI